LLRKDTVKKDCDEILATWEAEIGRITVQGQPKQKVWKTPTLSQLKVGCSAACVSSMLLKEA
jgi:hypothetical protein